MPSDALVGRAAEFKVINEFLTERLSKMVPGSMYVSGAPGTGKTAVIMKAIEQLQVRVYLLDKNNISLSYSRSNFFIQILKKNRISIVPYGHNFGGAGLVCERLAQDCYLAVLRPGVEPVTC